MGSPGDRPSAPRRAGFSLLELIVVLVVLTVMMAAVAPVFSQALVGIQGDRAVDDFTATLKYAQERAVADTAEHRVYIDADAGRYWIERFARLEEGETVFAPVPGPYGRPLDLPSSLAFDSVRAQRDRARRLDFIAFYPNAACDAATFRFRTPQRAFITVETKGRIGQVRVTGN